MVRTCPSPTTASTLLCLMCLSGAMNCRPKSTPCVCSQPTAAGQRVQDRPTPTTAQPPPLKVATDADLVGHLTKLTACHRLPNVSQSKMYCELEFRGLRLEFAGIDAPGGGTIYAYSLGPRQMLSSLGRRCLEVVFSDPDLRIPGRPSLVGTGIIFRNDAHITHKFDNRPEWDACD